MAAITQVTKTAAGTFRCLGRRPPRAGICQVK